MEFTLDTSNSQYQIHSYSPGKLKINESQYTQSVIITPSQLIHPWQPQNISELTLEDLLPLVSLSPQIILIGTGATWKILDASLLSPFYTARIGVEVMDTASACRTFNVLAAEERNVAAALLIR